MLRQYFEAKEAAGDALLLYRMGDFYELFFDDAKLAAGLLGLTLTSRHRDSDIEAPMCGVPHHAVEGYIAQLVAAGHRVAVCDQVEDARKAKGLVRREITRIVSPGTVLEPESLSGPEASFLAALLRDRERAGIAWLDVSTGDFRAATVPAARVEELLALYPARELLMAEGEPAPAGPARVTARPAAAFGAAASERGLREAFRVASIESLGFEPGEPAVGAAWAALAYAREMRRSAGLHISPPRRVSSGEGLRLDAATLSHLEIFESLDPRSRATLFSTLDCCATPMGSRALRDLLAGPNASTEELEMRLDAIEELVARPALRASLRERLDGVGDLARRASRVALCLAGPRELLGLAQALSRLPGFRQDLGLLSCERWVELRGEMPETGEALENIERCLTKDPPAVIGAGGAIASEADPELAQLRSFRSDAQGALSRFEMSEKERTGLSTLKVRYNRVFGYYIEISRGQREKAPAEYVRRQTIANAERYTTPELQQLESRILGAEERSLEIERRIFSELCAGLAARAASLAQAARVLGAVDLLAGLAETAVRRGYARPRLVAEPRLRIVDGRHPVVEGARREEPFVPNDTDLSPSRQIVVLTGPNMGGKSTYLRQSALVALLARAGSFVPAREAEVGPIDRIFTRVGAADHLSRGESTFMVEMIEASNILRNATPYSLVILDEVGRGTSTFDGLSLAWAIVEHLRDDPERRALTIFATHYHEMTELAKTSETVVNLTMAVREWEGSVVFLRKVVEGGADRSYGIHVAELAGLPPSVVARAREILANLEAQELDVQGLPKFARKPGEGAREGQFLLFSGAEELVLDKLRSVDVDQITPVAALGLLASLSDRLRK
jgi:DNA mismatch repair protein MutS